MAKSKKSKRGNKPGNLKNIKKRNKMIQNNQRILKLMKVVEN
jgi:hypothetical protein